MAKTTAAIILAGAALAGCAIPNTPVPVAMDFPRTEQFKLRAAAHWGAIAGHIEQKLATDLKAAPQRPYYITEPAPEASQFQHALFEHITSALVRDGYIVSRVPAGSLKVDIDVKALTFAPDRKQARYIGTPTAIATGVWALTVANPAAGAVGLAAGIDAHDRFLSKYSSGGTPKTELIVTVSVSDQYRYYARNSSAYYVMDEDRTLYGLPEDDDKTVKTLQVRGDK